MRIDFRDTPRASWHWVVVINTVVFNTST